MSPFFGHGQFLAKSWNPTQFGTSVPGGTPAGWLLAWPLAPSTEVGLPAPGRIPAAYRVPAAGELPGGSPSAGRGSGAARCLCPAGRGPGPSPPARPDRGCAGGQGHGRSAAVRGGTGKFLSAGCSI